MSSILFPALLIPIAAAIGYGGMLVIDAVDSRRRRRAFRGMRRGPHWHRRLPVALVVAAVASLALAFAQFQLNRQVTSGTVVLAIDVSRSMAATDVQPNRLDAAEAAAAGFLDRLPPGFRVGLVTFSTGSGVVVAPTSDRSKVQDALRSLAMPPSNGTVIGDGLSVSIDSIEADRAGDSGRPAAIVLLSDGRDSGSSISPDLAAARAAQLGVPVFTVAIGNVPTGDTSVNVLGQIAQQTGAKTYTTRSAHELSQVYDTLGSRLSYELAIGNRAGSFLLVAVLLILAAAVVALMGTRDPFDASNRRRVGGSPRSRPSDPTARRRQLPTR